MCRCMYLWQWWTIKPLSDEYFLAARSEYISKIERNWSKWYVFLFHLPYCFRRPFIFLSFCKARPSLSNNGDQRKSLITIPNREQCICIYYVFVLWYLKEEFLWVPFRAWKGEEFALAVHLKRSFGLLLQRNEKDQIKNCKEAFKHEVDLHFGRTTLQEDQKGHPQKVPEKFPFLWLPLPEVV